MDSYKFKDNFKLDLGEGHTRARIALSGPGVCLIYADGIPLWSAVYNMDRDFDIGGARELSFAGKGDWSLQISLKDIQKHELIDHEPVWRPEPKKSPLARMRDQYRRNMGLQREAFLEAEQLGLMSYEIEEEEDADVPWEDDPRPPTAEKPVDDARPNEEPKTTTEKGAEE